MAGARPAFPATLLILFALLMLLCKSASAAVAPVPVSTGQPDFLLGLHSEILEDPSRNLRLDDVRSGASPWKPNPDEVPSLAFSRSAWWLHFRLVNPSDRLTVPKIIEFATPVQDYLDIHLVGADGRVRESWLTGDRRPFEPRPIDYRSPSIPVSLAPGEALDVYVRLDTYDGLFEAVPIRLWDPAAFYSHVDGDSLLLGIYYGSLIALLLYNVLLFAIMRDRNFGYYVAYVASFFVWNFTFRGYALKYWWPTHPDFNNQILAASSAASYVTFQLFAISYLEVRERMPRWVYRFMQVMLGLSVLCLLPSLLGFYASAFVLEIPVGFVALVECMGVGVILAARGFRPARSYVMAFGVLAIGVGVYYLRVLSVLQMTTITENTIQIGSALEVLLLAFGLADEMNALKAEKLQAEHEMLAAKTALASKLEQQVQERTRELEEANGRLATIAITDELTGAFNRRHFNQIFFQDMRGGQGKGLHLALCILDVDHFKHYNDQYGHPAGDQVLSNISRVLNHRLRREGDKLFRLGGEEFAILMNASVPEAARSFVEELRSAIEQLAIPNLGTPQGVVTASFGLLVVDRTRPVDEPEKLYASADELLYKAKTAGRNRVESAMAGAGGPAQPMAMAS